MYEDDTVDTVINPADIRLAAMNLLARREHSVWELRRKLKRRFSDDCMMDEQLSRLAEQNLQCDRRFAESYVHHRINRGYGPVRLREELRERGVSTADSAAVMEALDIDWYTHAANVLRVKFGELPPSDLKEEARRARFMQHRGFTSKHYRSPQHD